MSLNLNRSVEELEQTIEKQEKRDLLFGSIGCSVFFIVVLVGLIFGGYKFFEARQQSAQLNTNSAKTEAKDSEVTMYFSLAMGDSYLVRYNFVVNNQTYKGEGSLAERPISKVVVEYDPENPNNNRVEGDLGLLGPFASTRTLIWLFVAALITLLVTGFINFISKSLSSRKRQ